MHKNFILFLLQVAIFLYSLKILYDDVYFSKWSTSWFTKWQISTKDYLKIYFNKKLFILDITLHSNTWFSKVANSLLNLNLERTLIQFALLSLGDPGDSRIRPRCLVSTRHTARGESSLEVPIQTEMLYIRLSFIF